MFRDRNDAALKLAERLRDYMGQNPLVLGIPRGGVVIASVLACELAGQLDIILTRKLGSPVSPELAMGAVDEDGNMQLNLSIISALGVTKEIIEEERQAQLQVIKSRAEAYRRICPKVSLKDRIVIIADDGIATGATMKAAIETVKAGNPQKLIVALPVGPPETIEALQTSVDEIACLMMPADFKAVGQFYLSFNQIEDDDVEKILRDFASAKE